MISAAVVFRAFLTLLQSGLVAVKEGCGRERGVTVGRGGGVFMLDSSPLPFKEVMMVEEWIEGIAAVSLLASTLLPNDTSA